MKLTRRGWTALGLVALAVAFAWLSGQRALNAVAAPLLAALLFGSVQVWRAGEPAVLTDEVRPGFPGQTRTWGADLEGSGVVHVTHAWPDGIDASPVDAVVGLPHALEVECTLAERGVYDVDALTVRRRDALGLFEAPVEAPGATRVIVYPDVYRVTRRDALSRLFADELLTERQEWDKLREYVPGDPLRHVHWKSSAKHDDFTVMEFAPSRRTESVEIAADAAKNCDDQMASAAGTIALLAFRADLDVGLRTPDDRLPVGGGQAHLDNVLRALARTGAGGVSTDDHDTADVSIRARPAVTRIRVGDRELTFADLVEGPNARPIREVATA